MQPAFVYEAQTEAIPTVPEIPKPSLVFSPDPKAQKRVTKFRHFAETYRRQAEDRYDQARGSYRNTPRRVRIAQGIEQDARDRLCLAELYERLAAAIEDGTLPAILSKVTSKGVIEHLRLSRWWPEDYADPKPDSFLAEGITPNNITAAHEAMQFYRQKPEPTQEQKIRKLEDDLVGRNLPGYFPTPPAIVRRMLDLADIQNGQSVCEPSAGKGNIADEIRKLDRKIELVVIECQQVLIKILLAKGYGLAGTDFLAHDRKYDRIVFNPPFDDGFDAIHVKHAYGLLNPGGRLVAIMSEGTFSRSDRKSTDFRDWLDAVGGVSEKLPSGAFAKGERPTGVATRIVTINK